MINQNLIKGSGHKRNNSHQIRFNAKRDLNEISKSVAIERTYKVSVQDMVAASKKSNDEFGLEGYENPNCRFNPNKRSLQYSVSKDALPRDYISVIQKLKKKIPGPSDYKTNPAFAANGKFFMSKGKNESFFQDVIN